MSQTNETGPAARMLYLHALSPLHTGTGQAAGILDLPVAREKATGWPVIPASSLKGVLRDALDPGTGAGRGSLFEKAFGPPTERASDHAGALCFGDQRLLCLPARSFHGTFAWITCPLALRRFRRDCAALGLPAPPAGPPEPPPNGLAHAAESVLARGGKAYLEDLDLDARSDPAAETLARTLAATLFPEDEREPFVRRFAVVADAMFDFLCETATEVTARVRLQEDAKTVAPGGLWYEEAVPAEALFSGPALVAGHARQDAAALLELLSDPRLALVQIGGKASVGRGLCRLVVAR